MSKRCDVLVLGSGPGGYAAAFRAADLGKKVMLVEARDTLGGVCLNVGCIPSKALLHMAELYYEMQQSAAHGLVSGELSWDMDKVRAHKDAIVAKLTQGLSGMASMRKVEVVQGEGRFQDAHTLVVGDETIQFDSAVIAAGSEPMRLPFIPEDPRVMDSTGALLLKDVSSPLVILGGGIIGCEMASIYRALGCPVTILEMQPQLMPGADLDLVMPMQKLLVERGVKVHLETQVTAVDATKKGLVITCKDGSTHECGQLLVSIGRVPNGDRVGAQAAGITLDRGFIPVDASLRTSVPHICAIGDICGQPMLAHKAAHQGHVAAEVLAGHPVQYDAQCIPSVAYTDPEVAWTGMTEVEAKAAGVSVKKGVFPWMASGRALCLGRSEGFTKILSDAETGRVIGAGIVGRNAGELIGELCLAIEMGCDVEDVALTVHPHPTLCESVGLAAEALLGHCTDLPPQKKS